MGTPPEEPDAIQANLIVPPVVKPRLHTPPLSGISATTQKARSIAFGILLLSVVCLGLGQTILFAVLPPVARKLGVPDIWVGAIFTFTAIMWVISSPFWGRKSDVLGRKPIVLMGVAVFTLSFLGLGIVMELGYLGILPATVVFALLFLFRSLHGAFSSAAPAAAQAYIADRTSPKERTKSLANIAAAFGIGASIGPGIGSATAHFGPIVPMLIVAGFAVCVFAAILFFMPELSRPVEKTTRPKLKVTDPRLRAILGYGVGGGILMVVPVQIIGFYLIDRLSLSDSEASQLLGVAFMVNAMASLFSQLVIIQRFNIPRHILLQIAPPVIMCGHLIIAMSDQFGAIIFGLMIGGLGTGLFLPAFMARVSLSVQSEEQGAAAGLANSATAMGFIIAPLLAFSLYKVAPQYPFIFTAVVAVFLGGYARIFLKETPD